MKKIDVKICVGTTCYVMGAFQLQHLEDFLDKKSLENVNISGAPCLGCCQDKNYENAPFVEIDGDIIANATIVKIIKEIEERLK
ncbi:NAD(P)H-dependent oxidoreductase subunit E [Lentisphaerota bacterium WC36G]|nr:NAD(P)H-dependent oxidoreductase subunit E [Lentisphaerae bacterium WC36]